MAKPFVFEFIPPVHAPFAEAVILDWSEGRTAHTYGETFVAMLGVMANIEAARAAVFRQAPQFSLPVGGKFMLPTGDGGSINFSDLQSAVARVIWTNWKRTAKPSQLGPIPQLPGGEDLGFAPLAWPAAAAISVFGIAATAGVTWWAIDRNEKVAEVEKFAASVTAQTDRYAKQLAMAAATGQPLPAPPKPVVALAKSQAVLPYWQLGAAAVLGGFATYGGYSAMQSAKPRRRRNPAPAVGVRRRLRRKAAPAPRKRSTSSTTRRKRPNPCSTKRAPTRRRNAVDRDAMRELELMMENEAKLYPQKQSIIENIKRKLRSGRYDAEKVPKLWQYWVDAGARMYVKQYGGRGDTVRVMFPKETREALAKQLAREYAPRIKRGEFGPIGTSKKKNPAKKTAPRRRPSTTRATKKAAPKRAKKAAPKRAKNPSAPKGQTPRAKFIRGQMRKGRSVKQATADWNGKQRLRKQRKKNPAAPKGATPRARRGAKRRTAKRRPARR